MKVIVHEWRVVQPSHVRGTYVIAATNGDGKPFATGPWLHSYSRSGWRSSGGMRNQTRWQIRAGALDGVDMQVVRALGYTTSPELSGAYDFDSKDVALMHVHALAAHLNDILPEIHV